VSEQLLSDAERAFPLETGGVLMGYWAEPYTEVVITHAIGPGPKAEHRRRGFIPDSEYQEAEIERIYSNSNRLSTYLGDWHTHPLASCYLSFKDKRTLHHIAVFPEARCDVPLMAVLGGGKEGEWLLEIWRYCPHALPLWLIGFGAVTLSTVVYDSDVPDS